MTNWYYVKHVRRGLRRFVIMQRATVIRGLPARVGYIHEPVARRFTHEGAVDLAHRLNREAGTTA